MELSRGLTWVGISDAGSEGTFKFESNQEIFPFMPKTTPWGANEPNGGSTENCAAMNNGIPMEFFDITCTDGRKYDSICELSSSSAGSFKI